MTLRVLLVDDSRVIVTYIQALLHDAPDIELLPPARDGQSAVESAKKLRPDVILMDIKLPKLSGIDAIKEIMAQCPCPIVVLSGHLVHRGTDRSFEALKAGAVEVVAKPQGLEPAQVNKFHTRLVKTIRLMSKACVVRRRPQTSSASQSPSPGPSLKAVLIGSSTGGPAALFDILSNIPTPYPLPILIAQHIIPGFEHGLAEWLCKTGHHVAVATGPAPLNPHTVTLAPADQHLVLTPQGTRLSPPGPSKIIPSVDQLFQSAAQHLGPAALPILLTGMGRDGAQGLLQLKKSGAETIAQDADSCVVNGMPEAARKLAAAYHNFSPRQISEHLSTLAQTLA